MEILAVVAAVAAGVYWWGYCTKDAPGAVGAAIKAASTGLLALLMWTTVGPSLFWTMALGMSLGAAGDWFLARPGQAAFLAGMAAFGVGHLAYAGGMLGWSAELGFDGLSGSEIVALAAIALLVLSTEAWLAPRTGALRGPVRGYVVLIGLMGVAAVMLPAASGQAGLRLGAALFLLSDLLLALRMFVVTDAGRQRLLSRALWPTYWGGQAMIGLGAAVFWRTGGG